MSKILRRSVRDQIVTISPDSGNYRRNIGPLPGRLMLEHGLADIIECEDETMIVLTDLGRDVRELVVEIAALEAQVERMKDGGLAELRSRRPAAPADLPPLPPAIGARPLGSLNHESFATFIASLNAAGLNRWQQPGFTGQDPPERPSSQDPEE